MEVHSSTVADILLVEDDPRDAELIKLAIRKNHNTNPLRVVGDGARSSITCSAGASTLGGRPARGRR